MKPTSAVVGLTPVGEVGVDLVSGPLSITGCLLNRALGLGAGGCFEKASAIAAVAEATALNAGSLDRKVNFSHLAVRCGVQSVVLATMILRHFLATMVLRHCLPDMSMS